ncbi:MAG: prolyl oligopeptidase family serine peptidase [Lentisphaerales bacterium]|nr:prolyl oligopeptidase family serine peptidase [Lentisphaerales bacterium]
MKIYIYLITIFFLSSLQADERDFAFAEFNQADSSLKYRIFKPADYSENKKYSLILTLHGSSLRGSDNKAQLKESRGPMELKRYIKKNKLNAIIVSPQCPSGERWVETPWYEDSHTMPEKPNPTMTLTIALMKSLIQNLSVDSNRVYVTGLSLGGFGCWDIIQREAEMFAAAIPICGGGDTAQAIKLKNLPIWIFHGDSDFVVKTKRSRDMFAALQKVQANVKYTEYPNTGHDSFTPTYNNDKVLDWLFKQVKE